MRKAVKRILTAAFLSAVVLPATGNAQGRVELAPVLGMYVPLMNVIELSDGTSAKQSTAPAIGARVSVAPLNTISFDANVTYTSSDVNASAPAPGGSSYLILINARAVWLLGQPAAKARLYFAGGGAAIIRGGEFYQNFSGTTDLGGNVAVGLRVALGKVYGRLEAESYLYAVNLTGGGGALSAGSQFQTDLVISASVAIPVG